MEPSSLFALSRDILGAMVFIISVPLLWWRIGKVEKALEGIGDPKRLERIEQDIRDLRDWKHDVVNQQIAQAYLDAERRRKGE